MNKRQKTESAERVENLKRDQDLEEVVLVDARVEFWPVKDAEQSGMAFVSDEIIGCEGRFEVNGFSIPLRIGFRKGVHDV
jgi:hypothetical protein